MRTLIVLLFLAIVLGLVSHVYAVNVTIDTTPPLIMNPTPLNGGVYFNLTKVSVRLVDLESGILDDDPAHPPAFYDASHGVWYTLSRTSGTDYDGVYECSFTNTMPGTYHFDIGVQNRAGLSSWYSAQVSNPTYIIDQTLKGVWTINNVTVASSSQTIYLSTNMLTFQFVQTGGAGNPTVSVLGVQGSTSKNVAMLQNSSTVWIGTDSFSSGSWNFTLQASLGSSVISLSITGVQISGSEAMSSLYWLVIIIAVVVLIVVVAYKAHGKTRRHGR